MRWLPGIVFLVLVLTLGQVGCVSQKKEEPKPNPPPVQPKDQKGGMPYN